MKRFFLIFALLFLSNSCFAMFCMNCGNDLPDQAKFCSECGKPILARVFLEDGRIILKKEFNGARPISIDPNNPKRLQLVGKVTGLFRPDVYIYEDPEQR